MKTCEILSVGNELLGGDMVDTNASYLSQKVAEIGYTVFFRQTVGDDRARIESALRLALSRADLVIATGGLGPTYDDLTREVAAQVMDAPLEHSEAVAEAIRAYFSRRQRPMSDNNLRQAQVPQGATVLWNDWGTAPGLWLEKEEKRLVLLPGVPHEMKQLFETRVLPRLKEDATESFYTLKLRLYGITESALDALLSEVMDATANPAIAPFAGVGAVSLHLTAHAPSATLAERLCRDKARELYGVLQPYCYGEGDTSPESALVERFIKNGLTVSCAESCTGGMLAQRITSVPNASNIFSLGACTYSEEEKTRLLGVDPAVFENGGVYSRTCALAMAHGIRRLAQSHMGIGITGVAGPGGGTKENPVGTVYIAVTDGKREWVEKNLFGHAASTRDTIRTLASTHALIMALRATDLFFYRP